MPFNSNIWSWLTSRSVGALGSKYAPFVPSNIKTRMLIETGQITASDLAVAVGLSQTFKI